MSSTSKSLITSWWLFFIISVFLWYRNYRFDRVLSGFILLLGLIQISEYAFLNGASAVSTARLIYIIIWLQPVVLFLGTFIYIKSNSNDSQTSNILEKASFILFIIYIIIFIYKVCYMENITLELNDDNIWWVRNDTSSFISNWDAVYWIGILLPLFMIFIQTGYRNISIIVLFLYAIFTALLCYNNTDTRYQLNLWSTLAMGFALLSWMGGIFSQTFASSQNKPSW